MTPSPATRLRLFGGLVVERDGAPVHVPRGSCATLVRAVAAHGRLSVDQLSEVLWPGPTPAGAAGRRLAKVLSRLRAGAGDLVVRSDGGVAVAPGVEVDLARFTAAAVAALALPAHDRHRVDRLEAALALWTGEPLAEDVYRDWAAAPRERARRHRLALLDALAEQRAGQGELARALRCWQQALAVEPLDEARWVRAAVALLDGGRPQEARRCVSRAEGVLRDLGLRPSPALEQVRRRLAG